MCVLGSPVRFQHVFVLRAYSKSPSLQTVVVFDNSVQRNKSFFCLVLILGIGQDSPENRKDIIEDVSFLSGQFLFVILVLCFCLYFVSGKAVTHTEHRIRQRQIVLFERLIAYYAAGFTRFSGNLALEVLMLFVEGSNLLHLFSVFILDEDIKILVFANAAFSYRYIVEPEVRHLIDFVLYGSQNILLEIREHLIFLRNCLFTAELWFAARIVFSLFAVLASIDFILGRH